jgi:hypothetical protein
MFRSPNVSRFLTVLGLLSIIAVCAGTSCRHNRRDGVILEVDEKKGTVTLQAEDAPVSWLLSEFQTAHGIRIVVPEFVDRKISISVSEAPLTDVVEQLLSPGTRYWIVLEKGELPIPGAKKERKGERDTSVPDLPKKGDAGLPPIDPTAKKKILPEEVKMITSDGTRGTKPPPEVREGAEPRAEKVAREEKPPTGHYALLRFRMSDEGITLESAQILPGTYIPDNEFQGNHVYAVNMGEEVVAVGSFRDPREMHAYFPDEGRPHEALRAKSGTFSVSAPAQAVSADALPTMKLKFYRLDGPVPTEELSLKTFPQLRSVLKEHHIERGAEILRQFPALSDEIR